MTLKLRKGALLLLMLISAAVLYPLFSSEATEGSGGKVQMTDNLTSDRSFTLELSWDDAKLNDSGEEYFAKCIIDPRFSLSPAQKTICSDDPRLGYFSSSGNDIVMIFRNVSPGWKASVELSAKNAFPGGNNIPLLAESSGIYSGSEHIKSFESPLVNVPLRIACGSAQTELFKGQSIASAEEDVLKKIFDSSAYSFFSMPETGSFVYKWMTESGEDIGGSEELSRLCPQEDCRYIFELIFTPAADALPESAAEPVKPRTYRAELSVFVKSGRISVSKEFSGEASDELFCLKLSGAGEERNAYLCPGESTCFPNLAMGEYTLREEEARGTVYISTKLGTREHCSVRDGSIVVSIGPKGIGITELHCSILSGRKDSLI